MTGQSSPALVWPDLARLELFIMATDGLTAPAKQPQAYMHLVEQLFLFLYKSHFFLGLARSLLVCPSEGQALTSWNCCHACTSIIAYLGPCKGPRSGGAHILLLSGPL